MNANGPAIGPSVMGPTVKKLAIKLILGRSQPEQRIAGCFSEGASLCRHSRVTSIPVPQAERDREAVLPDAAPGRVPVL